MNMDEHVRYFCNPQILLDETSCNRSFFGVFWRTRRNGVSPTVAATVTINVSDAGVGLGYRFGCF